MHISSELRRFAMVGCLNTAVDVGIFTVLRHAGIPLLLANAISTSCGLLVSFVLNARFTFRVHGMWQRILPFLASTGVGLWVLQPLIVWGVGGVIRALALSGLLWSTIAPKLCAVALVLIWNYAWYSRRVFAARAA